MQPGPVPRSFTDEPWPWLLATAGLGLALSIYAEANTDGPAFCVTGNSLAIITSWPAALRAELALNPLHRILAGWALMLLAMMPPLLAMPLMHVWRRSQPGRRLRASLGFLLGYCVLWMSAGPILIALALLLQMAAVKNALVVALLIAMVWSACPWQRAALNRCHPLRRIGPTGWTADRDCLAFGVTHGAYCIVSCWAWMLVPLVSGAWHIPVMLLAGAVLLAERLTPPERPQWHWPAFFSPVRLFARLTRRDVGRRVD